MNQQGRSSEGSSVRPSQSVKILCAPATATLCLYLALLLALHLSATAAGPRASGGYHTPERLEHALRNVERFDWARKQKDRAVASAAPWAALSDEELWQMVPGQDLPRAIDVTMTRTADGSRRAGCLTCGDAIHEFGNYPWKADVLGEPWKIRCPSCDSVFPTNDFGAYYQSGIDERGLFDPASADRSLLFNSEHPDPNDPLHRWGVDDGFGYPAEDGFEYRFIAYYSWLKWRTLIKGTSHQDLWAESMWSPAGLSALADAYVYTGDKIYARKAAILLDRIADVYPDMDWNTYAPTRLVSFRWRNPPRKNRGPYLGNGDTPKPGGELRPDHRRPPGQS